MEIGNTTPLLGSIVTAGIAAVTAFLVMFIGTIIVPARRAREERDRRARYLAIRVVCILDKYVAECATVSGDTGEEDDQGFTYPKHDAPDAPVYPTDVDWHSIDYKLMYDLQNLPAASERAANYVAGASEHASAPDYEEVFEARTEEYGKLAIQAYALSKQLRTTYAIEEIPPEFWSPVEYAQKQLDTLAANKEARAQLFADAAARRAETVGSPAPPSV